MFCAICFVHSRLHDKQKKIKMERGEEEDDGGVGEMGRIREVIVHKSHRPHSASVSLPVLRGDGAIHTIYIISDNKRKRNTYSSSSSSSTPTLCPLIERSYCFRCLGSLAKYKDRVSILITLLVIVLVVVLLPSTGTLLSLINK